jgi:uncharacterized ferritin-like protein (DUF455 family)
MPSASAAPAEPAARDLYSALGDCLAAAGVDAKLAAVDALERAFATGALDVPAAPPHAAAIGTPGRPARPLLVAPRDLAQRGLGTPAGRAALLHAVAHIEFNAIDLALDAAYRFRDMPDAFRADWISVAVDEARHFRLLAARLAELGMAYGDLPAHNGLWEMARLTAGDCLSRMALVPRVLEARGLDVTPGMIARLRAQGDAASVAVLEVILAEEVRHVAIGSQWFAWCCARAGRDPAATFLALVRDSRGALRGPFNLAARRAAGFDDAELAALAAHAARADQEPEGEGRS